jgi:integrase
MLTDAVIKGLKPRSKQYKMGDQGGLYLLIKPNGSKLWRLKYRIDGIEKAPLAFGVYPEVTLKRAREKQAEARKHLSESVDPAALRRQAREAAQRAYVATKVDTYCVIAEEWFALYVNEMKHSGRPLSSETSYKIEWLLNLAAYRARKNKAPHPLKSWLDRPIASFTKHDVAQVIGGLKRRGKIETAHRLLHCLVRLFKYAVGTERMPTNPAQAFADSGDPRDKLPPVRERNHPALTDPREVGVLLRGIDAYNGYTATQAAFKLAPILFSRPRELRTAKWPEFDLDSKTPAWRVPQRATKMRVAHIVPLPAQAIAILKELRSVTGPDGYVFPQMKIRHDLYQRMH